MDDDVVESSYQMLSSLTPVSTLKTGLLCFLDLTRFMRYMEEVQEMQGG